MPGASKQTRRVKTLNANWVAGEDGDDGRFEVLLITEDDERHVVAPSPASTVALVALAQADTVLLWDPAGVSARAGDLVDRHLGPLGDELQQPRGELVKVGFGEMAVERLAVRPLLNRDEAQRILDRGEEPVSQAALLAAGVVLHPLEQCDQLFALLRIALHSADDDQHL
jgi:hypothetical protein